MGTPTNDLTLAIAVAASRGVAAVGDAFRDSVSGLHSLASDLRAQGEDSLRRAEAAIRLAAAGKLPVGDLEAALEREADCMRLLASAAAEASAQVVARRYEALMRVAKDVVVPALGVAARVAVIAAGA